MPEGKMPHFNGQKNVDSLRKRYIYKLFTNLFGLGISLITMGIVPRALGPENYGNFNFLTNFFNKVISFLDMGTSTAFCTKISKRQKDSGLMIFYSYFIVLVITLIVMFVFISFLTPFHKYIWPAQAKLFVVLAAVLGLLNWLLLVFGLVGDAYELTVQAEIAKVFQRTIALAIIIVLFINLKLNILNFFFYQIFISALLLSFVLWIIKSNGFIQSRKWLMTGSEIIKYGKEFYNYSHPLFTYALIVMGAEIADRWLLQFFGGGTQQGFFSLSFNLGAAYAVFTTAMIPLLLREFSIAHGENDNKKLVRHFERYGPLLFSISAYFSCFVAIEAFKITHLFAGNQYSNAVIPIMIMAFYPIHQTYGQINGTILFATNQTVLYRNTGVLMALIGLPITCLFIGPLNLGGLGMGANGLAIKTVLFQFIGVNLQLYFIAKYLKISFVKNLLHQIFVIAFMLFLAFIGKSLGEILLASHNIILNLLLAGSLYTTIACLTAYFFPSIMGITKEDINKFIALIVKLNPRAKGSDR